MTTRRQVSREARGLLVRIRTLRIGREFGWTLFSRVVAAGLQMTVLVLLGRGLRPADFATVATVQAFLYLVSALNGFGLLRQLQLRRSKDHADPLLSGLFSERLRYSYGSSVVWLCASLGLYVLTGQDFFIALTPLAIWLLAEQTTQVWNGLSIVDGRSRDLLASYILRRLPVVLSLLAALGMSLSIVWAWTIGMAAGAVLAYILGWRHQEPWARRLWPSRRSDEAVAPRDLSFWWSQVAAQLGGLDVPMMTALDPTAAGVYAMPRRLMRPMTLVTQSLSSTAFPHLSRSDRVSRRMFVIGLTVGSIPAIAAAAALFVAAGLIPDLVGGAYRGSVPVLRVLCVSAAIGAPGSLSLVLLQTRSRAANEFAGSIAISSVVAQLTCAIVGLIVSGAVGAAVGATAAKAVFLVPMIRRALRETHLARPKAPGPEGAHG